MDLVGRLTSWFADTEFLAEDLGFLTDDVRKLLSVLGAIGHITVQCRKTKRGVEYIENNPRFGGGAPMSIMAGADSCEKLYRLLMGEELSYDDNYRDDVTFLRFDASIMLDENLKLC